jgi:hypothetical protein
MVGTGPGAQQNGFRSANAAQGQDQVRSGVEYAALSPCRGRVLMLEIV